MEKEMSKRLNYTFYEVDTIGKFAKFKVDAFDIGKIKISFVEYDTNTLKSKQFVDIYLKFEDAAALSFDIQNGILAKEILESHNEAAKNNSYAKAIREYQGGTKAETVKKYKLRDDGCAIARFLYIEPGMKFDKYPFVFKAVDGKGKEIRDGKKLLFAKDWKKPDHQIMVPFSYNDMKILSKMIDYQLQAYTSYCFMSGNYYSTYEGNSQKAMDEDPVTPLPNSEVAKDFSEAGESKDGGTRYKATLLSPVTKGETCYFCNIRTEEKACQLAIPLEKVAVLKAKKLWSMMETLNKTIEFSFAGKDYGKQILFVSL